MKKIAVFLMTFIIVAGLNAQSATQKVNINGLYSIDLPSDLKKTNNLNKLASLQYYNPSKEMYVIVIDESIDDLAKGNLKLSLSIYFKMAVFNIATGLKDLNISKIENSNRGNLQILQTELDGKLKANDVGIFYKIAIVQSPTHFYQIFTWTLSSQRIEFTPIFQDMINSFSQM